MPILTPAERIGTVLAGRYRIEAILGAGGMGVVFAGKHELTGRPVAIKLLQPGLVTDPEVLARFFQEAKASAALNHPNVVDVLDVGTDEDTAYLVLERLEGQALGARLEACGVIDPKELFEILLPVMDALAAAHERGIVHRDLKPDNVYIHRDIRGRAVPKVLDFGIAKLVETDSDVKTRTGGLLGTPHYMSPEQAQGLKDVGAVSDVWSMGVLLYECLAGTRPFEADSMPALLMRICTMDPTPLAERVQVHPAIARVVHRAMSRELDRRYGTMEELGGALMAAAKEAGVPLPAAFDDLFPPFRETAVPEAAPARTLTGPVGEAAPKRAAGSRNAMLVALAVALLAGGGAVAWALRPADPPPRAPDPAPRADPPRVADAPPPEPAPPEPPPEPAPAPRVERTLRSDPEGAEVYRDGALVGNTPFTVDVASAPDGSIELEVRADGYEPRTVALSADGAAELNVSLPRARRGRRGVDDAPTLAPR